MKSLLEFTKTSYKVYHGTNTDFKKFALDSSKSSQAKVGWFVDDYDYASSQGQFVKEFTLSPNKILSKDSILTVSDDDIINAIQEYKPKLKRDKIEKVLPKLKKNIQKYINGDVSGFDMFNGFGDVNVLKKLGFDMEILPNPYDNKSKFYIVYDDNIVN